MSLLLVGMCVFTQQAFPGAIRSLGLQQRGDPIGAHTHTRRSTPRMKGGEERQTGGRRYREITRGREEGRGKGSVNSDGARFELTSADGAHGEALPGIPAPLQKVYSLFLTLEMVGLSSTTDEGKYMENSRNIGRSCRCLFYS